jgi:hypothetical protein
MRLLSNGNFMNRIFKFFRYVSFLTFFIYFLNCASEAVVSKSTGYQTSEIRRTPDSFGNIILQESSNKQKLILTQTNQTIDSYDTYRTFENGYIVSSGDRYSILSRDGKKMINQWCEKIISLSPNILEIMIGGKIGIFLENKIFLQPDYERIELENGNYKVKKNNLIGIINSKGKILFNPTFDSIEQFEENYYIVELENEKGLYDKSGNLILPTNYDSIESFKAEYWRVGRDGEYGLVDKKGNMIFPVIYDSISEIGEEFIRIHKNDKYDIYNLNFSKINSTPLQFVSDYSDEFLYFKDSGKWGVMDKKGNIFISPKYSNFFKISRTNHKNLLFIYLDNLLTNGEKEYSETRMGIIDPEGNEILYPSYRNLNMEMISEDLYKISDSNDEDQTKYGILNAKFKTSTGISYHTIEQLSDSFYLLGFNDSSYEGYTLKYKLINVKSENLNRIGDYTYSRVRLLSPHLFFVCMEGGGGCGIINKDSKFTVQPNKSNLILRLEGNDPIAFEISERWGFITRDDKIITSAKFDEVKLFEDEIAIVRLGDRWGAIDKTGKVVVRIKYNDIGSTFQNFATVKLGNYWKLLDVRKGIVLEGDFDELQLSGNEKRIVAKSDDFYQIYHLETLQKIKDKIEYIEKFEEGITITGSSSDSSELRFGLMDSSGKIVLPQKYEKLTFLGNGNYSFKESSLYGIIDSSGKRIVRPIYSEIEYFDGNKFLVKSDQKYGLIDKIGKVLIPFQYNRIDLPRDKKIRIVSSDSCTYLDENFQVLQEECFDDRNESYFPDTQGIFNSTLNGSR